MANELQKVLTQGRDLWQKLPSRRRYILVGSVVATLAVAGFLGLRPATEDYTLLSNGLPDDESARIVEYLKAQGIPYRVDRGNAIEVPAAKLHDARLGMALNDVQLGGSNGFELFDKQAFGTTSFGEQVNYQRALQGELERTIRTLEPVQRARVHVARPERSLFKDDEQPPTASVTLSLKPGRHLTQAQIRGVVHVVAASVEGLQPERVTLIDESGAVLWAGGEDGGGLEGQQELERSLSRRIGSLVERVVGVGHAEVVVTAELDFAHTDRTEETYDGNKPALRSEQKSEEKSSSPSLPAGGVAGAAGNLPGAPNPAAQAGNGSAQKLSETKNYEINRIVNHVIGPKAKIKRLHVAVLVDYVKKAGAAAGSTERVTRTAEELKRIEDLVREAAGLDADRGDHVQVSSAQFAGESEVSEAKAVIAGPFAKPMVWAAMGAPALLIVMVLAFVLRRRRQRTLEAEALPMLPATVGELERTLPAGSQALLAPLGVRDRVAALARVDAKRAAEVISSWLAEMPSPQAEEKNA